MPEGLLCSGGIAEGALEGLIVCDTTTARTRDSERLAGDFAERCIRFLDAAVSGTSAANLVKCRIHHVDLAEVPRAEAVWRDSPGERLPPTQFLRPPGHCRCQTAPSNTI
jgi:hypothetical protein